MSGVLGQSNPDISKKSSKSALFSKAPPMPQAHLSRAGLVCENWYPVTDQRLPATRTNEHGGIFLVGPSGIEYSPAGDHVQGSSTEVSRPGTTSDQASTSSSLQDADLKQLRQALERGEITDQEFERIKHRRKLDQLNKLREQLVKGLVSLEAYNREANRIVEEYRSDPDECEVRITHVGTQPEMMDLVKRLRNLLDGEASLQKAVVEIVRSRFVIRESGINETDPELVHKREMELIREAEKNLQEKQAQALSKRRDKASKWLLGDLGTNSIVPGIELSDHNMSKVDKTVRAIVEEVQKADASVVVTPALQAYLRKYAILSEQTRIWQAQSSMEKVSLQESTRTVRGQAKALAKDQERKIMQLMEEKGMLDKRLRLMEQQSRASIADFALQQSGTQEFKNRIAELEAEVEELQAELRRCKSEFLALEESTQGSASRIKELEKRLAKAEADKNIEVQKLKKAHRLAMLERDEEEQKRTAEMNDKLATLTKHNENLREQIQALQKEIARLKAEMVDMEHKFESKLSSLEHQLEVANKRVDDLTAAVETAHENEAIAKRKLQDLQKKLQDVDLLKKKLEMAENDARSARKEAADLKAANITLEAKLKRANAAKSELEIRLKDVSGAHQRELDALREKHANELKSQLAAANSAAEAKLKAAGGQAAEAMQKLRQNMASSLDALGTDFLAVGTFVDGVIGFMNRALDGDATVIDEIPDKVPEDIKHVVNPPKKQPPGYDDAAAQIHPKVVALFGKKAGKPLKNLLELAHRAAGKCTEFGSSDRVAELEAMLKQQNDGSAAGNAEDGDDAAYLASDAVREAAEILKGAEQLYSGAIAEDEIDPVHEAMVERAETFVATQEKVKQSGHKKMTSMGDVAQQALVLITQFKTWRAAASKAPLYDDNGERVYVDASGEPIPGPDGIIRYPSEKEMKLQKTKSVLVVDRGQQLSMNEVDNEDDPDDSSGEGFGEAVERVDLNNDSFDKWSDAATPIVEQGESTGLPSLLPRTPRSALLTPRSGSRSAGITPRSDMYSSHPTPRNSQPATPRHPGATNDHSEHMRHPRRHRSFNISHSSSSQQLTERRTLPRSASSSSASGTAPAGTLASLGNMRPASSANRRGVVGGSVGDGAVGGGGGAFDPSSPRSANGKSRLNSADDPTFAMDNFLDADDAHTSGREDRGQQRSRSNSTSRDHRSKSEHGSNVPLSARSNRSQTDFLPPTRPGTRHQNAKHSRPNTSASRSGHGNVRSSRRFCHFDAYVLLVTKLLPFFFGMLCCAASRIIETSVKLFQCQFK